MPRYYNKTRGPLPLELPSGSTVVSAKSYIDIARSDEGCAAVTRYVKKGLLKPPTIRPKVEVKVKAPEKEAEVVSAVAPKVSEEVEEGAVEEKAESEKSSKKSSKKKAKRSRR